MDKKKQTLTIYGIQDRENYKYPFYVHDHNFAIMVNGKVVHLVQQERSSRSKTDAILSANKMKLDGVVLNGEFLSSKFF